MSSRVVAGCLYGFTIDYLRAEKASHCTFCSYATRQPHDPGYLQSTVAGDAATHRDRALLLVENIVHVFKEIYNSFLRVKGWVLTLVPLILSWLFWSYLPDTNVSLRWIVPVALAVGILCITLFTCIHTLYHQKKHILPRVIQALRPQPLYKDTLALLLLSPSPLFGQESLVSIFKKNSDFEILIGVGFVSAIQENEMIQVVVSKSINSDTKLWEIISANDQNLLKELIVKPSIVKNLKI